MSTQQNLKFSVDSALLSELGERLVERSHIALAELIKNAYDADASLVKVSVESDPDDDTLVVIEVDDNGTGMSIDDIKNYWMRIATTHKTKDSFSTKYGRQRTGAKGIGRFSCRRLGNRLTLCTTAKLKNGYYQKTEVVFDWLNYTPGSEVTEIDCPVISTQSKKSETGTTLKIYGGKANEWMGRDWAAFKRQLARLVANRGTYRRGYQKDPGFKIILNAPNHEDDEVVDLREQLINAGWGTLTINIDSDGKVCNTLQALELGKRQITIEEKYPELANTNAVIGIFPDEKAQLRDTSVLGLGSLREILKEWGGVSIKCHNVRVYPYGEPGNDWLNIDRDRGLRHGRLRDDQLLKYAPTHDIDPSRVLLDLLSSHAHMGDIELNTADETLFQIKASREGFIGEKGIAQLRKVIRFGVDWATIQRGIYKKYAAEQRTKESIKALEEIADKKVPRNEIEAVEVATEVISNEIKQATSHLPADQRKDIRDRAKKATQVLAEVFKNSQNERSHLRLIASSSSLLLIFSHEVKALLGDLDGHIANLSSIKRHLPAEKISLADDLQKRIRGSKERFKDLLDMTSIVIVDSRSKVPERLDVLSRAKRAVECFSLINNAYNIDIMVDISPVTKAGPILEAELYALFLNALSNAIKSVIAKGEKYKRIEISAKRSGKRTEIHVRDAGVGVKPDDAKQLFETFISDPNNRLYPALKKRINPQDSFIVGTGSGLGLSIVKEIVEARNGEVRFVSANSPWNADLEIILP